MKHKLRSRALTVVLSLMLIIGLMSATVFAAPVNPTTVQVNGTDILNGTDHTVSCGRGTATYDPGTNTLTLNNAEINYQQNDNSAGAILFNGDLNINLVGENTITSATCGIRGTNAGALTITGDSLTIDCTYYGIGIPIAGADITIDDADIDITAKGVNDFTGVGIQAGGVLSIKNGAYIDVTDVSHHPIIGNAGIEITDSTLYAQQYTDYYAAIRSENSVFISNSTVEARANSESPAIWTGDDLSSPPTPGHITISNGSDVTLYSESATAVYALFGDIDIENSAVEVSSEDNAAIYSYEGTISMTDSVVKAQAYSDYYTISATKGISLTGVWLDNVDNEASLSDSDTVENSVIIDYEQGRAVGNPVITRDVELRNGVKLTIPEQTSLTMAEGVVFKNNGTVNLKGNFINNNAIVLCADSSHAGGTATCTAKAVCALCGNEYGDLLPHNFENGKCIVCDAIDPDFKPVIITGANGIWQKGSKDGLSFTSNAAFTDFLKVQVDNKDLDASDYTVKEGSTIVTLKAEYLETLSLGKHTLAIVSETGTATTEFTIKAATDSSAQTGDDRNIALYVGLAILAAAGVAAVGIQRRREQ